MHRSMLLALTDSPRAGADLARIAHHAEEASDREAVLRFAPAAAEQAARSGAYREAAAQYARALRFGGDLGPGDRADLLEGRSPGLLPRGRPDRGDRGDSRGDPVPAGGGHPARGSASAHRAHRLPLVPWLQRGGGRDGLLRVTSRWGPSRATRHAYVFHTQALQALYCGDADGCFEYARRALEVGARFGDELVAGHARVTIGSATARRRPRARPAAHRGGRRDRAAQGASTKVAAVMNALVLRPMPWNRHDLVERAIDDAIEYCTEHTQDLWRINVQAVAARWALDRGRWDDAAGACPRGDRRPARLAG